MLLAAGQFMDHTAKKLEIQQASHRIMCWRHAGSIESTLCTLDLERIFDTAELSLKVLEHEKNMMMLNKQLNDSSKFDGTGRCDLRCPVI